MASRWEDSYRAGELPWDTGEPDEQLVQVVRRGVAPGAALEIGCGTGTNALWLASEGFDVLAVDLAPTAVERARTRAGTAVRFAVLDFLQDDVPGGPFDFVLDRGVLHIFDTADERAAFARRVAGVLRPGGMWLCLAGSTEGPARDHGPPRRSAVELVAAIEPELEIVELTSFDFGANIPSPARAWRCLARAREVPAQPSTRH